MYEDEVESGSDGKPATKAPSPFLQTVIAAVHESLKDIIVDDTDACFVRDEHDKFRMVDVQGVIKDHLKAVIDGTDVVDIYDGFRRDPQGESERMRRVVYDPTGW